MKSKAQIEREIKSTQINCNTYVSAWNHGNAGVRSKFPKKDDILKYFDGIIGSLKNELQQVEKFQSGAAVKSLIEKAPTDTQENKERIVTEIQKANGQLIATGQPSIVKSCPEHIETYAAEQLKTDFKRPDRQLNVELRNWQESTAKAMFSDVYYHNMAAQLLLSGVGTGKTFMVGSMVQRLIDANWSRDKIKCIAPFPIVIVTKATVVRQFESDLQYRFGIDIDGGEVLVTNYEQLRSKFGEQFIATKTRVRNNEPEIYFEWKKFVAPALIVWDECHSLKNESSTQHKVAMACNTPELSGKMFQIFMSATPFTRISDCRAFTCACRLDI